MANGRRNTCAWASAASLAVAFASAHAGVIYVRADASGANTGISWEHAFPDLQTALASARVGDEVWIAGGVYTPAASGGPRTSTFLVRNSIALFGGFAGDETRRDDRNLTANPTILSGDLLRDDLPGDPSFAGTSENAYHVVCVFEGSPTIDGFII